MAARCSRCSSRVLWIFFIHSFDRSFVSCNCAFSYLKAFKTLKHEFGGETNGERFGSCVLKVIWSENEFRKGAFIASFQVKYIDGQKANTHFTFELLSEVTSKWVKSYSRQIRLRFEHVTQSWFLFFTQNSCHMPLQWVMWCDACSKTTAHNFPFRMHLISVCIWNAELFQGYSGVCSCER